MYDTSKISFKHHESFGVKSIQILVNFHNLELESKLDIFHRGLFFSCYPETTLSLM